MADAPSLRAVIHACLDGLTDERRLSPRQWQVCRHLLDCRTAALGGFALGCDGGGERAFLYHACPTAMARAASAAPPKRGASANGRRCCR